MVPVEYLAGFVDGDGSLALARIRRRDGSPEYCIRVCVYNCNRGIIREIHRYWGGFLSVVTPRRAGWKPSYALIWTNAAAATLLQQIAPFLTVKSRQAAALLEFNRHVRMCRRVRDHRGRPLPFSQPELKAREAFFEHLSRLNRKGPSHSRPAGSEPGLRGRLPVSVKYLAGFVDAEGCLMIVKSNNSSGGRPRFRARVSVANTNRAILADIQRLHGGIIVNQPSPKDRWKHAYQLIWSDARVESLVTRVRPHLVVKREQATIILDFIRHKNLTRSGRNGRGLVHLSTEVMALRESLYNRIRALNARGISSTR